jgi:hypothetical protein
MRLSVRAQLIGTRGTGYSEDQRAEEFLVTDDPQVASALGGAKYGAAAGLAGATAVVAGVIPLSVLSVQPGFVFGYLIGIGMAIGAGIGWWLAGRRRTRGSGRHSSPTSP